MMNLSKIEKIDGGAATLESDEFALDNYNKLGFLFENADGTKLTVKVCASSENATLKNVPFVLKAVDADDFEEIGAEGKEITDAGAFLAVVTGDSLAHSGFDSASINLSADTGNVATVYALRGDPRYSE